MLQYIYTSLDADFHWRITLMSIQNTVIVLAL